MRSLIIISLSIMLSLSILGPSFVVLIDNHCDIEVALDLGDEENKKDGKKEFEEKDTFFQSYITPVIAKKLDQTLDKNHIVYQYRNHVQKLGLPAPRRFY